MLRFLNIFAEKNWQKIGVFSSTLLLLVFEKKIDHNIGFYVHCYDQAQHWSFSCKSAYLHIYARKYTHPEMMLTAFHL
jgi:hypothetical protein